MTETKPPAGWYKDPANRGTERWWDGAKWTAEVRNREPLDQPTDEAVDMGPEIQPEAATEANDPTTVGWHPDPAAELRRPRSQKGGGVLIVFAALAAVFATIITSMYMLDLSGASSYEPADASALPVAALLFGASAVLTLWGIYRGLEQINDIYKNVGWASDE